MRSEHDRKRREEFAFIEFPHFRGDRTLSRRLCQSPWVAAPSSHVRLETGKIVEARRMYSRDSAISASGGVPSVLDQPRRRPPHTGKGSSYLSIRGGGGRKTGGRVQAKKADLPKSGSPPAWTVWTFGHVEMRRVFI